MFPLRVPSVRADQVPDGVPVLDVREDDEWAAGHIDGSLHVPLSELPDRLAEVPADRDVLVVCRSGNRSAQAVSWLNSQGWATVNLQRGLQGWHATGRPLVSERGEPYVL